MSSESVSMRELELETAELLPSRDTLTTWCGPTRAYGSHTTTNTFTQQGNGNNAGFGNISIGNGASVLSGNNVLNGNKVTLLGIL